MHALKNMTHRYLSLRKTQSASTHTAALIPPARLRPSRLRPSRLWLLHRGLERPLQVEIRGAMAAHPTSMRVPVLRGRTPSPCRPARRSYHLVQTPRILSGRLLVGRA